jgi:hypothetical protein
MVPPNVGEERAREGAEAIDASAIGIKADAEVVIDGDGRFE